MLVTINRTLPFIVHTSTHIHTYQVRIYIYAVIKSRVVRIHRMWFMVFRLSFSDKHLSSKVDCRLLTNITWTIVSSFSALHKPKLQLLRNGFFFSFAISMTFSLPLALRIIESGMNLYTIFVLHGFAHSETLFKSVFFLKPDVRFFEHLCQSCRGQNFQHFIKDHKFRLNGRNGVVILVCVSWTTTHKKIKKKNLHCKWTTINGINGNSVPAKIYELNSLIWFVTTFVETAISFFTMYCVRNRRNQLKIYHYYER